MGPPSRDEQPFRTHRRAVALKDVCIASPVFRIVAFSEMELFASVIICTSSAFSSSGIPLAFMSWNNGDTLL